MTETNIPILHVELVHDTGAILGEGPCWHPDEKALYWVDIEGKELHRWLPESGTHMQAAMPYMPGAVVPIQEGGLLVALENGLATYFWEEEFLKYRNDWLKASPNLRANDGKCDPQGRFWIGSMDLGLAPGAGSLYRVGPDLYPQEQIRDLTISNGLAWTASGEKMYFIDSATQQVCAYDMDAGSGELTHPRVVIEVPQAWGTPDGMSIDVEGKLWIAHWGDGCVRRWDPQSGKALLKVEVPAPHATSCAFGGEDFRTLYITTAQSGLDKNTLGQYPHSGGLFSCRVGTPGRPVSFFNHLQSNS